MLKSFKRKTILKEGQPKNSKFNILGRGAYDIVFKAVFRAKPVAITIVHNPKHIHLQIMCNKTHILGWDRVHTEYRFNNNGTFRGMSSKNIGIVRAAGNASFIHKL